MHFAKRIWKEDHGLLAFEWILLFSLLVIGVIGGIGAARDALIDELGDVAQAVTVLDQTFSIDFPLGIFIDGAATGSASNSLWIDSASYTDCSRTSAPLGQSESGDDVE